MQQDFWLSDAEFLRLKSGNQAVFKKVFKHSYGLIRYVVQRCGVQSEECADIIQETFLKLHQNFSKLENKKALNTWLVTTARNLAVDHLRKHSKLTELPDNPPAELQSKLMHYPTHELEIMLLGKLIDQVATDTGDVTFSQFYRKGMTAKQIAEENQEPISSVTNRLSRLRKKFSENFKQHIEELRASLP